MNKKFIISGLIVFAVIAVLAISIFANNIKAKQNNIVQITANPFTGEVPATDEMKHFELPSYYEEAATILGNKSINDSDIIIRFHTYIDYGTVALNCSYYSFDLSVPQESGYTITTNADDFYETECLWAEKSILSFQPTHGMKNVSDDNPVVFYVYKDGNLVDTIRLIVEDVVGNIIIDEGKEIEGMVKKITSCENDCLKVAYYNYDMFAE